jgi:hypothetical protein
LGIKNLEVWNNIASMLNHIWTLFTKAGSLSVAWIEVNWLKGKSLWQVFIPKDCSWSWKKLKLRDVAKKFLSYKVGDGSRNFFGMISGILLVTCWIVIGFGQFMM